MPPNNQQEDLLASAGWVMRAKRILCTSLVAVFSLAHFMNWIEFPFLYFLIPPLLEAFVNQPHHRLIRKVKNPERVFIVTSVLDVIFITWSAHYLGDLGAFLSLLLYPLVFIYAGVVMDPRQTFFFANLAFLCFAELNYLEYAGIIPPVTSLRLHLSGFGRFAIVFFVFPLYNVMAYFVWYLSGLLRKREKQLVYNAFHDELTGLPSRELFMERLKLALIRAGNRDDYLFAVIFLDLDRFKIINGSLGHGAGDKLLTETARRIEACVKSVDTVARVGGDEFAILLEDLKDIHDPARVAERIQQRLGLAFDLGGMEAFSTASIGIALSTTGYELPESVLRDAHTAMYRAKSQGRARHELFDVAMRPRVLARLELETDLRKAVDREEFSLYYQPIIALATNTLVGFEALVRWRHPRRGLVLPSEFIPTAEETALIIPIGWWVLRAACEQIQRWHDKFNGKMPLSVSINLSGEQFKQGALSNQVKQVLGSAGQNAKHLKLEITESVLIENVEATIAEIDRLKELDVQLYMDDFGTGYSSLSYLRRLNVDKLKIDRSFVSRMERSAKDLEIVRSIVLLAHGLSMEVIAEGIETASQLEHLVKIGCDFGQGYYFSEPVSVEAAEKMIETQLVSES